MKVGIQKVKFKNGHELVIIRDYNKNPEPFDSIKINGQIHYFESISDTLDEKPETNIVNTDEEKIISDITNIPAIPPIINPVITPVVETIDNLNNNSDKQEPVSINEPIVSPPIQDIPVPTVIDEEVIKNEEIINPIQDSFIENYAQIISDSINNSFHIRLQNCIPFSEIIKILENSSRDYTYEAKGGVGDTFIEIKKGSDVIRVPKNTSEFIKTC